MTRQTIIIDVLRTYYIRDNLAALIAHEICAVLDLPGKVNHASHMHDAAFGSMNYARDRWEEFAGGEHAKYWEKMWRDRMRKQRYYFQRRAMLMSIDEAQLW